MGRLVEGDVVVIPFPFSDMAQSKKRPALIIKNLAGNDILLCQITRNSYEKKEEISISNLDFIKGNLKENSYVRFTKLFSGDVSSVKYRIGKLKEEKYNMIIERICSFLKS